MAQLFANNAATTLLGGISSTDTELVIDTYNRGRFPAITNLGDYYLITVEDTAQNLIEIMKVTSFNQTTGLMRVIRGQEGWAPQAFSNGVRVQMRVTRDTLYGFRTYADQAAAYTHKQKTSSAQWIVTHNLNRMPSVVIEEGTWVGDVFTRTAEVEADVLYINPSTSGSSLTQAVINFSEAIVGRAIFT